MPWNRCTLVSEDDDNSVEVIIDVLTDAEGLAHRGIKFFGQWREFGEVGIEPFVHNYDDRMDWGNPHVSVFPLRGKRIFEGAVFSYRGYETKPAEDRGEISWACDFVIKRIDRHS